MRSVLIAIIVCCCRTHEGELVLLQNRWKQLITIAVVVSLVLAVVAVGLGIDALHKSKSATPKVGGPVTTIIVPRSGQVVSGSAALDAVAIAASVTAIDFVATGGSLHDTKVATAGHSLDGWVATWNTTTVANGAYQVASVGYSRAGRSVRGPDIMIKVENF